VKKGPKSGKQKDRFEKHKTNKFYDHKKLEQIEEQNVQEDDTESPTLVVQSQSSQSNSDIKKVSATNSGKKQKKKNAKK
jgi:hypothetical protein